ncbi:hypothetical protein LV89_03105 [Arcicella aurantiaca]|uniref:Uncharacterized protein n=1 Tax=Arcicella aurantiaca TaxID=591202 RepID=A0A316DZU9_9BACT|nr:hypothetical protein LV89_03105 [Arcicella aurantiaca]
MKTSTSNLTVKKVSIVKFNNTNELVDNQSRKSIRTGEWF